MSGNEHSISAADWRGICAQPLMFRHLENIARSECLYSPLSITRSLRRRNGGRIMSAYLIKILRCFGAIFISAEQLERCLSSFNHFFGHPLYFSSSKFSCYESGQTYVNRIDVTFCAFQSPMVTSRFNYVTFHPRRRKLTFERISFLPK